jgi:UDP-N-acetylglucosamine diphosphorylase / glucose-1-phosphate thymidylyltransferase / UDP-N-acetylgalactosamine diphosphorylase / glucosamine-1-phosphate N-acetyltransferase / galactosamine-1-phosphate N-acetyltransferase
VSKPALVLFDDRAARNWRPLSLTRPAGEILFGSRTLRRRAEEALGLDCAGHVADPTLADYDEPWAPPCLSPDRTPGDADVVWLLSRFAPEPGALPDRSALLALGDRIVGARLPGGTRPDPEFLLDPDAAPPDLPRHAVAGTVLDEVWDLMAASAERVARDLARITAHALPPHVHHIGDGPVSIGRGVEIAPGVVLDTRDGPIRLEDGVRVHPFTSLVGPAWIGPGTALLGGPFNAVAIGPRCKVHGEMEESVVLGYSNKAHDGFLGHAVLGMWVNLGALTTNSDLKNNYGTVRVWTPDGETDTGHAKVGCFLGDHVKTAIGTMLNTGTVIEAGSNIFGGMPPRYVPAFSWGEPDSAYEFDRFIATAETVMRRRDVELTDRARRMLEAVWRAERR